MSEGKKVEEYREKLGKTIKILKELEEKYKRALKDRAALVDFVKTVIPPEVHHKLNLDCAHGNIELEAVRELFVAHHPKPITAPVIVPQEPDYKYEEERKLMQEKLKYQSRQLKELEGKLRMFETEKANSLLVRMKATAAGYQRGHDRLRKGCDYESKISEQSEAILRLKDEVRQLLKAQRQKEEVGEEGTQTDALPTPVAPAVEAVGQNADSTKESSASSFKSDESSIKIVQLQKEAGNLKEMLELHREMEEDLNRKVKMLERSKTKEEVNYEYLKNIFTKYLAFLANGSEAESKQLESMLLDLLHFTKQEREELDKARTKKSSFFSFFSKKTTPSLPGSYIPPTGAQRAQSVNRAEAFKRAGSESCIYPGTRGDLAKVSTASINILNKR